MHLPVHDIRASQDARDEYLGVFSSAGVTLTALNCNGNLLDPNPEGPLHAKDVRDSIELAALLGVKRVVTMSGLPGSDPGGRYPSWTVEPWHSVFLDARDYQWNEVGIPFWKDIQARAADADVKVCIEMHPHNLVYNPATMERLATEINATHVGAEMDPSHLFWQGIDPVLATQHLGGLVYNAAAKDTRINEAAKPTGCSTTASGGSPSTPLTPCPSAAPTPRAAGQSTPPGTSWPSAAATTPPSGPTSCAPCARSTPTWPSTSSTKTRSSTNWRASAPPRP